jgi:glutathione S-transferase
MMKLFTGAESGNSWKVRILLEQLEVPYEKVYVDLLTWEHSGSISFSPTLKRGFLPRRRR